MWGLDTLKDNCPEPCELPSGLWQREGREDCTSITLSPKAAACVLGGRMARLG